MEFFFFYFKGASYVVQVAGWQVKYSEFGKSQLHKMRCITLYQ